MPARLEGPMVLLKKANLAYGFVRNSFFTVILNCKKPTEKNCVSDQTCVVLAWLKRTSRLSPTSSDNWWSGARQTWRRPGQSSGGSPSKTSTQSCSKTRKGATHPWDCCEESNLAPSPTTFCLNGYAGLKSIYLYHSGFVKLPVSALLSSNQYVLLQFGNQRLFDFFRSDPSPKP